MSALSSIAGTSPSALGSAASPTGPAATASRNPYAEVSSEEWLGIILEELQNQDPFEPNDTSATLEQLNSLRSIESDISLADQLESLVLQNSIGQAGSLIGKQIEGLNTLGQNVTGTVESVRVVDGKSQLQMQTGGTVEFNNVTNVTNAPAASSTAPSTTATSNALTPSPPQLGELLAGLTGSPVTAKAQTEAGL